MAYFICEKQGRCCPHEFYDSIEQAIADSEDGVPCDHLIEVAPVRHGKWIEQEKYTFGVMYDCSICGDRILDNGHSWNYCANCGARMDGDSDAKAD